MIHLEMSLFGHLTKLSLVKKEAMVDFLIVIDIQSKNQSVIYINYYNNFERIWFYIKMKLERDLKALILEDIR